MRTVGRDRLEDSYRFRFLRSTLIVLVATVAIVWVVLHYVLSTFYIPSASMETTLNIGDRVLVQNFGVSNIHRGDIIVFKDPNNWLKDQAVSDGYLVKRVIGIPGDTVSCCDAAGRLQINGVGITEPYVKSGQSPSEETFTQTIPANSLWVMGDNRDESEDSRYHTPGYIPVSKVVGKVIAVYYPFGSAHVVEDPSQVFVNIPGAALSARR